MFWNGELTAGAVGIMTTIILASISGIVAIVTVYFKTRTDINALQISYTELKTDIAKMDGKQDVVAERLNRQDVLLEQIKTRLELMGAITGLPDQIAVAVSRLRETERRP